MTSDPEPDDLQVTFSTGAEPAEVTVSAGDIDLTTAPDFRAAVDGALAGGGDLLVDLTGCDFLDSSGLAVLVDAYRRLHGSERRIVVAAVADGSIDRVLDVTLKDVIHQVGSRDAALAWLRT